MRVQTRVTPWLGFRSEAEEAANFYTSIIPDSRIVKVMRNPASGASMVVEFELGGLQVFALNTGADWKFTEAFSFSVACDTQSEIDRVWAALTAGGKEIQCGWLADRYGLHWQVVPSQTGKWLSDPDTTKTGRMMAAMMQMVKLDIATLQAAFDGKETGR